MNITIGRKDGEPLSFDANSDEKVLHAALRNRLTVPYECATGTCGSCRAKLVSGEIDHGWSEAPGKKSLKIDRGEFLMCQCVAQTDCEIRIPSPVTRKDQEDSVPECLTGSITGFEKLTADVQSFRVLLDQPVGFQAGQFMLLQLPGVEGTRAYSMVNFAEKTDKLEFVIKQLKGGKCSEWLFDQQPAETDVTLFGPLGQAIFEPQLEHDLLLLAGGSGIAGMMAMLEHADNSGYIQKNSVDLIFGVRTEQDIFYLQSLIEYANRNPDNLQITIALSDVETVSETHKLAETEIPANLKLESGFVHEHISDSRTNENTMAFIAGPPPMVDASIRELIAGCEFSVERIRYDKFA